MSEQEVATQAIKDLLERAVQDAEALQSRLERGEEVSEDEMTAIAKSVAESLESANASLRAMLGPVEESLMRERMIEGMSEDEFEQWSQDNAALQQYRADMKEPGNG